MGFGDWIIAPGGPGAASEQARDCEPKALDGAVVAKFPRELGYVTDASGKFVNDGGASNRYFSGEDRDLDPPIVPGK